MPEQRESRSGRETAIRRRRHRAAIGGGLLACLALAAGVFSGAGSTAEGPGEGSDRRPALLSKGLGPNTLAGQRTIVGFSGTSIPKAVRRGVAKGRIGGVILFSDNVPSRAAVRSLTDRLQKLRRPKALRRYPLLVMTDQEGGLVKRLPGAPTVSAAEMARRGPAFSRRQGRLAGRNLDNAGINVNLAPVVDVARPGGDIAATDRGFGSTVKAVERNALPFATALENNGVAATAKHFPGLGSVRLNTDDAVQKVPLSKSALRKVDEAAYQPFIEAGVDLIMVGTAIYPAFGPRPAAFEKKIVTGELRRRLGYRGVTVTDALGTVAARDFGPPRKLTVAAARAGMDLMLFTDFRNALKGQDSITDRLKAGKISPKQFRRSVDRILRLRARLAAG